MEIKLIRTQAQAADFVELVALLDAELAIRDGAEHAFYSPFNSISNLNEVVLAYCDNKAIGCGAFKPFNPLAVEIKRMYVHNDYRNLGIASKMIAELEKWALEKKFNQAVLETGKNQPEALALYHKLGYHITENYGQYIGVQNSICMAKSLVRA